MGRKGLGRREKTEVVRLPQTARTEQNKFDLAALVGRSLGAKPGLTRDALGLDLMMRSERRMGERSRKIFLLDLGRKSLNSLPSRLLRLRHGRSHPGTSHGFVGQASARWTAVMITTCVSFMRVTTVLLLLIVSQRLDGCFKVLEEGTQSFWSVGRCPGPVYSLPRQTPLTL